MRDWLRETHGPGTELLRHFLLRFFDSDLVTAPGQTTTALIGAFSIFLPWFPLIVGPLRHKYAYFSSLAIPDPYRQALRADELWLITLMMSAIGLLTAVKWQSLFPGLRDYYALGSLPLRAREIFAAKLLALLLVATAAVVTLNAAARPDVPGGLHRTLGVSHRVGTARGGPHHRSSGCLLFFLFRPGRAPRRAAEPAARPSIRPCDRRAPGTPGRDHAGAAGPEFLYHAAGRQHAGSPGTRALASAGLVPGTLPNPLRRSRSGHARARPAGVVGARHRGHIGSGDLHRELSPPPSIADGRRGEHRQRSSLVRPPFSSGWCPIRASRQ